MDAIDLLTQQHDEVRGLFRDFEQADSSGDRARVAGQTIRALRAHTAIEEEIFYPAIRRAREEIEDDVLEGLEEHHAVEVLLDELEAMSEEHEHYVAKYTVVSELIEHHAEEEEEEMFPEVRNILGQERLDELGGRMGQRHDELMGEDELLAMSKEELYTRAQQLDLDGRSGMTKRQLANAVRGAG